VAWDLLTLKVALSTLLFTRERRLWFLLLERISDLSVRDVADLVVFVHKLSLLVANTTFFLRHQSIASLIGLANIAVDAFPSFSALALLLAPSWFSIASIRKGST
jgi:hypothetical protein